MAGRAARPLVVGPLADATSLKQALAIVPLVVALAAVGLALVSRTRRTDGAEGSRRATAGGLS